MSNRFLTAAWKAETDHPSHKLVLARLADSANEDGETWPKVATVARDTGLSHRQVIRVTRDLEAAGLIRIQKRKDRYRENCYQLSPEKLSLSHDRVTRDMASHDAVSLPQVTPATVSRDTVSKPPAPPYRKNHQEPTYEPVGETSVAIAAEIASTDRALQGEKVLSGLQLAIESEIQTGAEPSGAGKRVLSQVRRYIAARDGGKFEIRGWSISNFLTGGHWQDEQTWHWKPEHRPEPRRRYVDPATLYTGPEYQRRAEGA